LKELERERERDCAGSRDKEKRIWFFHWKEVKYLEPEMYIVYIPEEAPWGIHSTQRRTR